jgi:isoleucyl-tRNA synthetase
MVLDSQGRKISKRLGNYVDIYQYIEKYGVDVIRTYLIGSPLVNANPLLCNTEAIENIRSNQIRYINGVRFFLEHASNFQRNGNNFMILGDTLSFDEITNVFDKWILSQLVDLSLSIEKNMGEYKLDKVVYSQTEFVEDLVNWYLKFNRSRMKGLCGTNEWMKSLSVLHYVIHTYARLCSPVTPFISEYVHRNIYMLVSSAPESIHLMKYPEISFKFDNSLHYQFDYLKKICETVRAMRDKSKFHTTARMPIKRCVVFHDNSELLSEISNNIAMVNDDINCIKIDYQNLGENVECSVKPNLKKLGQQFKKDSGKIVNILKEMTVSEILTLGDTLKVSIDNKDYELTSEHFTIVRNPVSSESELVTTIVGDMMIGIDFTVDEDVTTDYITKCMHSSIQNSRKALKLHPWDKVVVRVNPELKSKVSDIEVRLKSSLTNSEVIWGDDTELFSESVSIKLSGSVYNTSYNVKVI